MESLLFLLSLCPSGEPLIFEWDSGLKIKGKVDTFFNIDNGLKPDDIDFKKYQAIALKIENVLKNPENVNIKAHSFFEISEQNLPKHLFSKNGIIIWSSQLI